MHFALTIKLAMHNNKNGKNNHNHRYYNQFPPIPPSISPRISFSNNFVESQVGRDARLPSAGPEGVTAAATSDFEFSVANHSMMSADELFFKGRILPSFGGSRTMMTLRDELLVEDDEEREASSQPTRGNSSGGKWKGLLGLRKGGKKGDSSKCAEASGDRVFDDDNSSHSREMLKDGVDNNFKK